MGTPSPVPEGKTRTSPDDLVSPVNPDSNRRRSQVTVMVGLLLTFSGLFAYGLQLPTQPARLDSIGPWLAIGFVAAWTGGILAGNSLISPPAGVSPALRGQLRLSGLATVAGALSAAVVVQRLGLWTSPSFGVPAELLTAGVAIALVWIGGFLMGHSMRRFVRRRRRAPEKSIP